MYIFLFFFSFISHFIYAFYVLYTVIMTKINLIILRPNVTQDQGLPCLGVVGVSVWGLVLLVVGFSCVGKYIALLISSLGMSGAAPSTRLMRALNLRGSCS